MQILSIFDYKFMVHAFIVGTLIAIILPCIGLTVVLKRLSLMGETLSHASLAGVAIGLFIGIDPLLGSALACVVAGFGIEFFRTRLKAYQEISTMIMLATAIGLTGIFTSFLSNTNSITSYLFGSIVTVSKQELYLVCCIACIVLISYVILYDRLYLTAFDPFKSDLLGINRKAIDFIFMILTAITVAVSAKTIGSLIVSSLLVIPTTCAMQVTKSYKATLLVSIVFSIIFVHSGLYLSSLLNLKPGAVIVLFAVTTLIILMHRKTKK